MNPHKGEIDFQVGNRSYKIIFTTNAICQMETELGMSMMKIGSKMATGDVALNDLRVMLWAGLSEFHPEITIKNAGEIIDYLGFQESGNLISQASQAAFGEAKKNSNAKKK